METRIIELSPISPSTLSDVRMDAVPTIEEAFATAKQKALLENGDVEIKKVENFPGSETILIIIIKFASIVALETYRDVVIPALQKHFEVREQLTETRVLELSPIGSDTPRDVQVTVVPLIEETLKSAHQNALLDNGEVRISKVEDSLATITTIRIVLGSDRARQIYESVILPKLTQSFRVTENL